MDIIYSREGYDRPTVGHMGATDSENNLTDCMSSHLRSSQCYVTHCVRISPDRNTWSMFKPSLQNDTLHKAVYLTHFSSVNTYQSHKNVTQTIRASFPFPIIVTITANSG